MRSSSVEVSKHGLPGLQHRLEMLGVCDWATGLFHDERVRSKPHGLVSARIDD
jgi:hypothetical protein